MRACQWVVDSSITTQPPLNVRGKGGIMKHYKQLKEAFRMNYDKGDSFACVMGWRFALADYMTFAEHIGTPSEWEYKPSVCGADEDSCEYQELQEIQPAAESLERFGDVLYRYDLKLRVAGMDY